MLLFLIKAWRWLRVYWAVALAAVASAAAFMFYRLWVSEKKDTPVAPDPARIEKREEQIASEEIRRAETKAAEDVKEVHNAAEGDWAAVVEQTKKDTEVVQDIPEATGNYLDAVSKSMRKP
jgi:hypothetical protein